MEEGKSREQVLREMWLGQVEDFLRAVGTMDFKEYVKQHLDDDLLLFWEGYKSSPRATVFPDLLRHIREWHNNYRSVIFHDSVELYVPRDVFKAAFGGERFDSVHVTQGLCGVISLQRKDDFYVLHINLKKIWLLSCEPVTGRKERDDKFHYERALFEDAQFAFRSPWHPVLDGDDCPQEFNKLIYVTFQGEALRRLDALRRGYERLDGQGAERATRTAPFVFAFPEGNKEKRAAAMKAAADGWAKARSFFAFVRNQMVRCLLFNPDGSTRAFVRDLRGNCVAPFCSMIPKKCRGGIQGQLAKLVIKGNLKILLQAEIDERRREIAQLRMKKPDNACRALLERISHLEEFIRIVDEGHVVPHLQEWARVMAEANSSRLKLALKDPKKVGAPKFRKASKIDSIPLCNARPTCVSNFLSIFNIPVEVQGLFRDETETVVTLDAFDGDHVNRYNVRDLCKMERGEIQGRCQLTKAFKKRKHKREDGSTTFYYHSQLRLLYTYEVRVVLRTPVCLGNGLGGITLIDPGGRKFTVIRVEGTGERSAAGEKFELFATEHFKDLPDMILKGCARAESFLSRVQLSRNARNRNARARHFYRRLWEIVQSAKENGNMDETKLRALGKQLGVGMHYMRDDYKTDAETMAEETDAPKEQVGEESADVLNAMAEASGAMQEEMTKLAHDLVKERQHRNRTARRNKDMYEDECLGPLWTPGVEERYRAYCTRREKEGLRDVTRRFFLKYKVEKRMRRRAKWIQRDIRRKVKAEQNAALPELVPVGTSLVFCARLNFHNFTGLSRRIKKYFSYLALASLHDRMELRCENVGAVLLNVCEGYTTKKCPACGKHVNVGSSKKFECDGCGFECERDLKGTWMQLDRGLNFVIMM